MSAERANLVELASIQVREAFWHCGCDISENELKSMTAMQVELGATRRISIRPGFIFELQSTDKVTNNLTDAALFEEPFLLTVLLDRRRPMEIAHLELCR